MSWGQKKNRLGDGDKILVRSILAGQAAQMAVGVRVQLPGIGESTRLPNLNCFSLDLSNSRIKRLPETVKSNYRLNLSNCRFLEELPVGLRTGSLNLSGCTALSSLPEKLEVNFLDISGCTALEKWPESARAHIGSVNARGCANLEKLPDALGPLTNLNLAGCAKLKRLPTHLRISGWLDLAGTQIDSVPEAMSKAMLRWRGVRVSAQVVFFPETLTVQQILAESNTEVRRVMMERFGLVRFMKEAEATVLDEDSDAGGKRQLLRVRIPNDEELVCVSLNCPSTGRHYVLRVPPGTTTCKQAVAWTAGFDNPDDYNPIVET